MSRFNPNIPGIPGKLFGLPYQQDEADIVILPVPWDVTASYGSGASNGPQAILDASIQIDYCIPNVNHPWKLKVVLDDISDGIHSKSKRFRKIAARHIKEYESNSQLKVTAMSSECVLINRACEELNNNIASRASDILASNKTAGCLGGDHSTSLGLIRALSKRYQDFGILQVDAHMDLREAYEGFEFSHASIMHNALKNDSVTKLVQVGVRDYCESELSIMDNSNNRIITYFDQDIKQNCFNGLHWAVQVKQIIKHLPSLVYISFDIDGLQQGLCPSTGTPVPGGLSYNEVTCLMRELVRSGRKIIGFDLSEVCPGQTEWDANVAARVLYQLCIYTGVSHKKLNFNSSKTNTFPE